MLRRSLVGALVAAVLVALPATALAANPSAAKPVPSLTPAKTMALWQRLVHRQHVFATRDCAPSRLVFYAASDWLRLATKLAANASPCAQYYISIPPLAADKTQLRNDQAWRIRALGPNFHPLAEIHVTGWANAIAANGGTWHDAGVEARRRMAAAGFDVTLGDGWIVNELSSAVRQGSGNARANLREFVRGLYEGDGTLPVTRGAVFVAGMSQATRELAVYQSRLQDWYDDAAWWNDMSSYVSDWSQELYGDVRDYAVPGADVATRVASLNDYLEHETTLANVAPESATPARAFLSGAYNPLANAAWQYDAAFGWTNVTYDLMQDYVSAQAAALRAATPARFGFAWAPKNLNALASADFAAQTNALLDRLAAAIADPAGACTDTWCTGSLDGSAFNDGWQTFGAWKPSRLSFTTASQSVAQNAVSQPLTVQLQTSTGIAYTAGLPLAVTLTTSSAAGELAADPAGPWTSSLQTTIASGTNSVSFYYRDADAGSPVVTVSAAGKTGDAQTIAIADVTAPETTFTSVAYGYRAVSFTFASSEPDSHFECSFDYGAFVACSSPWTRSGLSRTTHTLRVRAIDAAGNVDASPAAYSFRV